MANRLTMRLFALALAVCALLASAAAPANDERALSPLALTDAEREYIGRAGTLRVGYVDDRIPVSFTGEDGNLAGISRYVFDRLSELSGLSFEYVVLPEGSVTYDYLLEGGFDLVTSVEYNKENLHARGILMSSPYLSSRKVVVAREDLEFNSNAPLTVAISSGSQTIRKVLGDMYPNFSIVDYDSISECFDAVDSGEADLMIQNQYVVEYWIAKPAYEKLKVIPVPGLEDELCFSAVVAFGGGDGPSEEDGELLIDILDKAIALLGEDEVGTYTIQAIMENKYSYTLSDTLYRYRYSFPLLIAAALIISLLTFLLIRLRLRSIEARADAKAKGEFLSTMSHEIRTPLNGLIGLNYLMAQKLDDREQLAAYLRQSTATAKYLLSLVNDILDMSKLEEEEVELSLRRTDLQLLLDTVRAIVQSTMSSKGIDFSVDARLPSPYVIGDEVRIQQVLMNLLDNARKFTPRGGRVSLVIRQSEREDGKVVTRVEVADNGKGMSEEFQKQAFNSFAQERDTVSKGNQGTGLGLPISRRLARLMGGDLTFTSRPGEGSTFFFTFVSEPCDPPEEELSASDEDASAAEESEKGSGGPVRRVLVAEDNELNAEIMTDLLHSEGFEVVVAKDGQEAVDIFSGSPIGFFPVILMDLLMPGLDGFQATEAIRALEREDAETVRIIACTANSFSEDRDKAFASGMDDFIAKPVDIDELLMKLSL